MGREDLDRVAAHAERAALEVRVAALVLLGDEVGQELSLVDAVADRHLEGHRRIGLYRADAVDAGDRGDDDDVVALQEGARRGVAHPVDLLVDRGFLLDIGVGARDVGLRLVVVVIGDEILDRVVREEVPELRIELRGQRLVRRKDDGGALRLLDHLGHGVGLARAGDAEKHLRALVLPGAGHEVGDRRRLVAGGRVVRHHPQRHAALGLLRPGRPVRRPDGAVLVQRVAGLDQLRQRLDRRRHAGVPQFARILQADVHSGDGVQARAGPRPRVVRAAHGGAAGGLEGVIVVIVVSICPRGRAALRAGLRTGRRTAGGARSGAGG